MCCSSTYQGAFAHLTEEVKAALATVEIEGGTEYPWHNTSEHRPFASYYDEDGERAVSLRTKWVFDQGYDERLQIANGTGARADDVPSLG